MPNRLITSTSPYLLQHAHNPVDWYPWGDEALGRARSEDRPIFLSIGYSACHWCHVMERESFEDPATAQLLNQHFVSIKVDREERPDLDHVYMQAVMAIRGGHGGWPLSAFLTPDGHLFFGGTYWPPEPRFGMPAFRQVLERVVEAYQQQRDQLVAQSREVTRWLEQQMTLPAPSATQPIDLTRLMAIADQLERGYDYHHGGFGSAPKFPHALHLDFLLQLARVEPQAAAAPVWISMATHNLECMALGGIYDQLGGGFARYSVDEAWLIPHFEKMLYDNALLARVYLSAGVQLANPDFLRIGRETLDYMLRDLGHPGGPFYSAEDADSEGVEGKFYVWDQAEIVELLGKDAGRLFCDFYGVTASGNFEGSNILHRPEPLESFVARQGGTLQEIEKVLAEGRARLFEVRQRRTRPLRDEKVLANWNALALSALSQGAIALGERRYYSAAHRAWDFIEREMLDDSGELWHSWKERRGATAFLDDYSFLVVALLDLYQVEFDERWIERAVRLAEAMVERFSDPAGAGFFYTSAGAEKLVVRYKDGQESSIPSGNAMAAFGLARLGRLTDQPRWSALAAEILAAHAERLGQAPLAFGQMLITALDSAAAQRQVIVAIPNTLDERILAAVRAQSAPGAIVAVRSFGHPASHCNPLNRIFEDRPPIASEPTLYLCEGTSCQLAISGVQRIADSLTHLPLRKSART